MLSTQLIIPYYPVILSHRRSTTVSLETYPLYFQKQLLYVGTKAICLVYSSITALGLPVLLTTHSVHYMIISLLTTLQLQSASFQIQYLINEISRRKFKQKILHQKAQ